MKLFFFILGYVIIIIIIIIIISSLWTTNQVRINSIGEINLPSIQLLIAK